MKRTIQFLGAIVLLMMVMMVSSCEVASPTEDDEESQIKTAIDVLIGKWELNLTAEYGYEVIQTLEFTKTTATLTSESVNPAVIGSYSGDIKKITDDEISILWEIDPNLNVNYYKVDGDKLTFGGCEAEADVYTRVK